MSGPNVISLDPSRRARPPVVDDGPLAMLVFVIFEAMMFTGIVSAFLLTRAASGGVWPPDGQPWFPPAETVINSAALLSSGVLTFLAAQAWERREARASPLLLAAIAMAAFFLFFQGVLWVRLIGEGLVLTSSQHGSFFSLAVGLHAAHVLGALIFMAFVWGRLRRGALGGSTFSAARILWYFVVGLWPVLALCLYL